VTRATEVRVGPDDGMTEDCALSLDNLRVIRKAFFTDRICRLQPKTMHAVCRALGYATGCEV
jgi:mRNA-degrading endonuclease toxin of MazEF toxin-antitoxin module